MVGARQRAVIQDTFPKTRCCILEMMNRIKWRTIMAKGVLCLTCLSGMSCSKTIDVNTLQTADRIEVKTPADERVKEITDPADVRIAIQFISDRTDGWRESMSGPLIPNLMFHFYRGQKRLGGFGISQRHIVADPIETGWLSRSVSADETGALLRRLGVSLR
jgi:hypothetical protein